MTIRIGDHVTLHYRIFSYGQEIADTFPNAPERFCLGDGDLDARLEALLTDLSEGEHRFFELQPWQAFGEIDNNLVQTLPRADFPANMALPLEHQVEFDLPNGQVLTGTVLAVDAETVTIDFNHPLAGLPIELEVQILAIDHA